MPVKHILLPCHPDQIKAPIPSKTAIQALTPVKHNSLEDYSYNSDTDGEVEILNLYFMTSSQYHNECKFNAITT